MKKFINFIILVLGFKSELTDEAVDNEIIDFSGQGRNKYGR